jgi:sec-independent protein translocase protein TatB
MMKPMSFGETIFLFVLALVVFGPKKLPEIARQVGRYLNEFKRASNEFKAQIEQEIAHIEVQEREQQRQKNLAAAAEPEGTASRSLKPAPADPASSAPALSESSLVGPVEAVTSSSSEPDSSPPASSEASSNSSEMVATEAVPAVATEITPAPATQESHV